MRAGVQTGDRIVKVCFPRRPRSAAPPLPSIVASCLQVNGTLVTRSNHMEVVKLIKCECERGNHESAV